MFFISPILDASAANRPAQISKNEVTKQDVLDSNGEPVITYNDEAFKGRTQRI